MKPRGTLSAAVAIFVAFAWMTAARPRAAVQPRLSYSSAQAWQGSLAFTHECAYCHAGDLRGFYGPALIGRDSKIPMETAKDVWEYIVGQMPLGNSGGLSQKQYVAIMAFILQKNGLPAGKTELTAGAVDSTKTPIGQLR